MSTLLVFTQTGPMLITGVKELRFIDADDKKGYAAAVNAAFGLNVTDGTPVLSRDASSTSENTKPTAASKSKKKKNARTKEQKKAADNTWKTAIIPGLVTAITRQIPSEKVHEAFLPTKDMMFSLGEDQGVLCKSQYGLYIGEKQEGAKMFKRKTVMKHAKEPLVCEIDDHRAAPGDRSMLMDAVGAYNKLVATIKDRVHLKMTYFDDVFDSWLIEELWLVEEEEAIEDDYQGDMTEMDDAEDHVKSDSKDKTNVVTRFCGVADSSICAICSELSCSTGMHPLSVYTEVSTPLHWDNDFLMFGGRAVYVNSKGVASLDSDGGATAIFKGLALDTDVIDLTGVLV